MAANKIIVIHSRVAAGYVGSNTTSLVFQLGGHDVITVPTVLYSNHLGHATAGGGDIPDDLFSDILRGLSDLGVLDQVSMIMTGFFGSAAQVRIASAFIKKLKLYYPAVYYLCDPVMGDTDKGLYVSADVPDAVISELVPLADLLTPNQFEMERMLQKDMCEKEDIARLSEAFFDPDRQQVVMTGGRFEDEDDGFFYNFIRTLDSCEWLKAKMVDLHPPGTGELFTAHLYLRLLGGSGLKGAVTSAGHVLTETLQRMKNDNRKEFELNDIIYSMDIRKK